MHKKLLKIDEPEKSSNQLSFQTNCKHCMRIISDLTPNKSSNDDGYLQRQKHKKQNISVLKWHRGSGKILKASQEPIHGRKCVQNKLLQPMNHLI